ncbi:hypothetical protein PRIPAC_86103, partial [Pristionchus pacificus]
KTEPVEEPKETITPKRKKKNDEEPVKEDPKETVTPKRKKKNDEEPVKEEPKETVTPKRKKKNDDEPGTSKSSTKKSRTVKEEPEEESTPKKRKGRPSSGNEKKKIGLPINDAQDKKNLTEFKRAKAPKDILTVYVTEPELLKFFASAIRAANDELRCPGCKSTFTSHTGITYHIQRCKESVIDWEAVHDTLEYADLQTRPWKWVNAKKKAKEEMANEAVKENNGSVECVRFADCGVGPFSTADELMKHLNQCCVPTYNQFRGQIAEFRALEKKTKTILIRLAMNANGGQLPCLECGKYFNHKYGILYHLERCGFTEENADMIPWKCYRCGFEGTAGVKESHLDECGVPPSEAVKPKKERLTMDEMDEQSLAELATKRKRNSYGVSMASGNVPAGSSQTRLTSTGLKRFKFRKSEAMQQNITITSDLERYRTAVAAAIERHEQTHQSSPVCEMLRRRADAQTTPWERESEGAYISSLHEKKSIGLRQRTLADFSQSDEKITSNSKRTTFPPIVEYPSLPVEGLTRIDTFKTTTAESPCSPSVSIGYAGGPIAATLLAPTPLTDTSECLAVLTFPDDENLVNTTTGKANWRATDAYVQLWKVEKSKEEKKKKSNDETREVTRCDLSLWFVLRIEGRGLALAACWMPRTVTDSPDFIGYLAVAMSEGSIVICCIRKDSVPLPVDGMEADGVIVVAPPPVLVLRAPTLEQVNDMKRNQRQERRVDTPSKIIGDVSERITRSARNQLETILAETTPMTTMENLGGGGENGEAIVLPMPSESKPSISISTLETGDVKPLTGFTVGQGDEERRKQVEGEIMKNGRLANVQIGTIMPDEAATQTPIITATPKKLSKADMRKEVIKMRLAKPEYGPPPQPPIIAVSWSPFGECSTIAAVDAAGAVIVWELDDNLMVVESDGGEEGGKRRESLHSFRVFVDVDWVSPAINVGWMDTNLLGISFAERMIRVLDTSTGECQLEENTVRTAGKSLLAQGACFEGLFIYQSEFYTASEAPETAVVYLAYGADKDGYFVAPLSNRHGLMVWAVGVSSSGVIGTAGADGRMELSMNGKVVPRGCGQDLSVNLHTEPILLIRNRVTELPTVEETEVDEGNGAEKKNPLPPAVYATYDDVTTNMWLDIVCEDADTVTGPALPQGLLDSRVESLNAITLSTHSTSSPTDHVVVTGGQAGLLFARSCHIEEKGIVHASWLNLKKWSNPSSKESTPRPKSRTSHERTPKGPE